MRIAMVSEHASPLAALGGPDAGGQNVYVARLSTALAARGHQVTVYTRRDAPGQPRREPLAPGVVVEHVRVGPPEAIPKDTLYGLMPAFGSYLARAWAEDPPDVVHAHYWMSGLAALDGAHAHGIPVVQTFHALGTVKKRHQGAEDSSPFERIGAERHIGRTCSGILATCTDEVYELGAMGVPPRQAVVVPCGVDTEHFRPASPGPDGNGVQGDPVASRLRTHRAFRNGKGNGRSHTHHTGNGTHVSSGSTRDRSRRPRRLLSVGRLVPRKGFDLAIEALTRIEGTEAELVIAGGPEAALLMTDPEAERLTQLAERRGVADRVHLLGCVSQDEMPALMHSADLMLCTPVYEPFGIVPLEAMACGLPVVATAVGGHLDSVADRVSGRLVEPGDPAGLARTVDELLADPELLRAYGAAGRERALARFTWERVADDAEQLYARVASRSRTRTPTPTGAAR